MVLAQLQAANATVLRVEESLASVCNHDLFSAKQSTPVRREGLSRSNKPSKPHGGSRARDELSGGVAVHNGDFNPA